MTLLTSDQDTFEQPQNDEVVLSVKNVSKRFCRDLKRSLFYGIQDIAGEVFGARRTDVELRKGEFWALNDVSFELRRGEALGLVGANGAGKTTLLRIISGLIKPDHGSVEIQGRVAPLIALGAGFNPILTGRENIYVNMSILGLSKEEIDERFDQVVEFAEIGEAIDAPVQSYSSGMAARLGFACAIHTEPDILLIDEVLAVGDVRFQSKCYRRLADLRNKSVAFIMVSHNPEAILGVCNQAIYLSKGEKISSGEAAEVMNKYEEDICYQNVEDSVINSLINQSKQEVVGAVIKNIFFRDENNHQIKEPISGQSVYFCIECEAEYPIEELCVRLSIQKQGQPSDILFFNNLNERKPLRAVKGINEIRLHLSFLGLMPGLYNARLGIHKGSLYQLDVVPSFRFKVKRENSQTNLERSQFYQKRDWKVEAHN
ncbi:ABC transporter ATP-binding protein [Nodularia spumigena]|uniref:Teichoic acids export ATP-binding protein TagH n=1 Tax=Nodularia spumigena UHCC 0039 TaxID=1914872 RepID=A0A2S0Q5I1_NODSP|nr:ABC transporter ATP-binding protein [Nodularia spumigena]AVZ31606.1 teichoic acids export ATP-binding protein TagH [Nodularia spumigena UHCC 0039]